MSPAADVDVLVVGAGVSGLAAARELERRGASVLVVDDADAPGGVMRSDEIAGHRIERGPNTLLLRAPLLRGLERFGLADALVSASPASRSRFLARDGELVPVPLGPLDLARTPLLSGRAKRRLLREPFVARGDGSGESVAEFIARRLGPELVEALVGPFLTGVYAGDERRLGAEAVFPSLVEAERSHGSIVLGLLASVLRRGEQDRGRAGTWSHPEGLGGLAAALAAGLDGEVRQGVRVQRIVVGEHVLRVELEHRGTEQRWTARRVLVAAPAAAAATMLAPLGRDVAEWIGSVSYAPVATVALSAPIGALRRRAEGFGFLVPRGEGRGLLGCLFMSELFEGRAPAGRQLLHCLLGGVRAPELLDLDDEALARHAIEEVDSLLGVAGELDVLRVARIRRAVAQPLPGHRLALQRARSALAACGPIELAGGYTDGVSVADSFASGVAAACRLADVS